jgi:hypothetical protein
MEAIVMGVMSMVVVVAAASTAKVIERIETKDIRTIYLIQ